MGDEQEILTRVQAARQAFGVKCHKLAGSVTVEVLRSAFLDSGISVSPRDVFVRGVPVEFDLLIPAPTAAPADSLVYEPSQVIAVLEVKNAGSFGDATLTSIRRAFGLVRQANSRVYCAYVALAERKGYRWAATDANLGADTFTLFWHNGSEKARRYDPTGDWARLVNALKSRLRENAA